MNRNSRSIGVIALTTLAILMLIGVAGLMSVVSPLAGILFLSAVMIVIVILTFFWIFNRSLQRSRDDAVLRQARAQLAFDKPKNGSSLAELMSVLSDDDLDDLRQHIKQRLMDQVDAGDDDYVESFEELLDETKRKRR